MVDAFLTYLYGLSAPITSQYYYLSLLVFVFFSVLFGFHIVRRIFGL